jgi:hypothetical protein
MEKRISKILTNHKITGLLYLILSEEKKKLLIKVKNLVISNLLNLKRNNLNHGLK